MHELRTLAIDDRFEVRINAFLPSSVDHLFNESAFFQLHSSSELDIYAQLVRRSDGTVHGTFACYDIGQNQYASPKRGTFGGLSARRGLDFLLTERFLRAVLDHVRSRGATAVHVKCAPLSHDLPLSSITANIILRAGGKLSGFELNYDLPVDTRPFASRVDSGSRKRIRKCKDEGYVATEVGGTEEEARVYELIRANRERRGVPITMSAEQLEQMKLAFPDRIRYFAVLAPDDNEEMVASAVCISLSSEVLYVFYWGDGPGMQAHSPVAILAEAIYEFAQANRYRLLDAGTSTSAGAPNLGLIAFKRGLGFTESLKPSYAVDLRP